MTNFPSQFMANVFFSSSMIEHNCSEDIVLPHTLIINDSFGLVIFSYM